MECIHAEDLLNQLKTIESTLSSFSFESLNVNEATTLKTAFRSFSALLEGKVHNPNEPLPTIRVETNPSNRNISTEGPGKDTKFIAHISHEIRTPLNGIIGFTNLLREDNLNESQSKKVDAIHIASQKMMEIINEVLEYSKIASGMKDLITVNFNFRGLINDIIFLCQTLLIDRSIDLQIKIDENIPKTLVGDPSKLSQILLNLLGNAIKFVDKGFIVLQVSLRDLGNDDCMLQFVVADSGIGMSTDQLAHVFDRFKQANGGIYQKYGGTGLGLCIVKELVERQGGEISVESQFGKGTTFRFNLAYKKGSSKNIPQPSLNTIHISKGREMLGGTKILVFEDNEMNQHLIKEQLHKCGCGVYVTSNLDKGLGILRTQQIDVILMDLKMPGLNGFQISEIIRADRDLKQVPIIAFSADYTAIDEENYIASGINDFLLKPYTLDELLNKLLKAKNQDHLPQNGKNASCGRLNAEKAFDKVNLLGVLEDCCGDISVLQELICLFKQNVYEFIGKVKMYLKQGDLKEIGFEAHKLKAGIKMLQLENLVDIMMDMQVYSEQGNQIKVRALFEDFLIQYPEYEKQIDKVITQIKNQKNN